jgi:hypothetical protein
MRNIVDHGKHELLRPRIIEAESIAAAGLVA